MEGTAERFRPRARPEATPTGRAQGRPLQDLALRPRLRPFVSSPRWAPTSGHHSGCSALQGRGGRGVRESRASSSARPWRSCGDKTRVASGRGRGTRRSLPDSPSPPRPSRHGGVVPSFYGGFQLCVQIPRKFRSPQQVFSGTWPRAPPHFPAAGLPRERSDTLG